MKRFGFVINRADSSSNGTGKDGNELGHWKSVYVSNEDDFPSIEYYDSLAESTPSKPMIDKLRQIAQKMNPEKYFKLKVNNLKVQPDNNNDCGYYAIKFLEDRHDGVPFEEATMYKQFIDKYGGDYSKEGIKEIKNFKSYL
jgi:Ulp1 family protease